LLCVLGDDPFQRELQSAVENKLVNGHRLRVEHFSQALDLEHCQLLFVSKSERKRISAVLADLRKFPVLTIGETEDFLSVGGMIRFSEEDKKPRAFVQCYGPMTSWAGTEEKNLS
jgi:uncharacterized protein DUF4154